MPVFFLVAVMFPSRPSHPMAKWTSFILSFVSFAIDVADFLPLFRAFQTFPAFVPTVFSISMLFTCEYLSVIYCASLLYNDFYSLFRVMSLAKTLKNICAYSFLVML